VVGAPGRRGLLPGAVRSRSTDRPSRPRRAWRALSREVTAFYEREARTAPAYRMVIGQTN